jgi:hypothetical protein
MEFVHPEFTMQENVKFAADVITTAMFYKNKGASVAWYITSMAGEDKSAQEDLRVALFELGFLTNANSSLMGLNWNVNPR